MADSPMRRVHESVFGDCVISSHKTIENSVHRRNTDKERKLQQLVYQGISVIQQLSSFVIENYTRFLIKTKGSLKLL